MYNRRNALWFLMIILLVAGLFTGRAIFFSLALVLFSIMLLSAFWAWLAVRGLRIGRQTRSRRSQVGHNFSESFQVRNVGLLPKLWLEIRDHSDLPGHRASHVVPTLNIRSQYRWRVETACIARGSFQLGPMTIVSGDPFGLFLTPRRIEATQRMIVYPKAVPLRNFHLPANLLSGGEPQRYQTQNVTTNAAGVREYVPGDSINRIHWKSTARRGKLIVKEFELDPFVDIWLFADFSLQSLYEDPSIQRIGNTGHVIRHSGGYSPNALPPSTEEYIAVITASLANYFIDEETALGFIAHAPQRTFYRPERGHRQQTRILETLAVARSLSPSSLHETMTMESQNVVRGATLILITSSLDIGWIGELQLLARRGIRPICLFVDATTFGMPGSSDEVRGRLHLAKIPTITIRKDDNLAVVLEERPVY